MKKISLLLTALMLASSANAQLKVTTSGQVQIGTNNSAKTGLISDNEINATDSLITLRIIGKSGLNSGGLISFGNGHVSIGESSATTSSALRYKGAMQLIGNGGISYYSNQTAIFTYNPEVIAIGSSSSPFAFSTTVSAPQYLTTSDVRLKTNIEALDSLGARLGDITPVSYQIKDDSDSGSGDGISSSSRMSNDSQSIDRHRQFGFLAQDVKEVYPDLVYENSEGIYSIDYIGFIAILVDAVQNLQATVKSQGKMIGYLKDQMYQSDGNYPDTLSGAVLKQNKPNPFKTTTVIQCTVPESVSNAMICVYDLNGQQKLHRDIQQRGTIDVTIEGNTMSSGMYIYTLICDGVEIDSKRMILTD